MDLDEIENKNKTNHSLKFKGGYYAF